MSFWEKAGKFALEAGKVAADAGKKAMAHMQEMQEIQNKLEPYSDDKLKGIANGWLTNDKEKSVAKKILMKRRYERLKAQRAAESDDLDLVDFGDDDY